MCAYAQAFVRAAQLRHRLGLIWHGMLRVLSVSGIIWGTRGRGLLCVTCNRKSWED